MRHAIHRPSSLIPALLLGFCVLAMALTARAQTTVYWDVNGNQGGTGISPTGTWSTSSTNWNTKASGGGQSLSTWTNGNNAVFSAGVGAVGSYTVTVSGTVDAASIVIQEGTPTFAGGTIRLAPGGTFDVGTNLTTTVNSVLGDWNYSGLNKTGAGNLVLGGANTFQAPVTVSAGTLTLANNDALGQAGTWNNTVASGATLALQGGITVNEGGFKINGAGAGSAGAINNVSGTNTLGGAVTLMSDSTIASSAGALTLTGDLSLNNADTSVANNLAIAGAGNVTLSGAIYGGSTNTQFNKNGSGTLTLAGTTANTFQGAFNVNSGTVALAKSDGTNALASTSVNIASGATLRLDANNQIADYTGPITVAAGGTLNVNGKTESVNTLASNGTIALGTGGTLTVGVNSGNVSIGNATAANAITGTGTLIKGGSGTLALLSNIINSNLNLQLSAGTLALSGYNLTAGTLHVTGNSTIDFGGGNSTLSLTNLIIDSGVTLTITNWTGAADYFYTQGWTGASFDTSGSPPMNQVIFSGAPGETHWQSNDKQVTPVPEPATYGALLLLGAGGLAAWRRWRRA